MNLGCVIYIFCDTIIDCHFNDVQIYIIEYFNYFDKTHWHGKGLVSKRLTWIKRLVKQTTTTNHHLQITIAKSMRNAINFVKNKAGHPRSAHPTLAESSVRKVLYDKTQLNPTNFKLTI